MQPGERFWFPSRDRMGSSDRPGDSRFPKITSRVNWIVKPHEDAWEEIERDEKSYEA